MFTNVLPIEDSSVLYGEYLLDVNNHVTILGFNDHDSNMHLIHEYSSNMVDCIVIAKEHTFNYFNLYVIIAGTTVIIAVTFQTLQV
jgi:hypothetical protein